jgi:hypothetical protein
VKVLRKNLFHLLPVGSVSQNALVGVAGNFNYYGQVMSGTAKSHYTIKFDALPHGHQEVDKVRRAVITVLERGEDEPDFDHRTASEIEECSEVAMEKRKSPSEESTDEFCNLDKETIASATTFLHKYGEGDDEHVKWTILKDTEHITDDPMDIPDSVEFKKEIDWGPDPDNMDYNKTFFDHFFPSIQGHAKLIDKFHADPRSPYFHTVRDENIQFYDHEAEDPDWMVRVCYTLMIAAASEVEVGVENLWRKGRSNYDSMFILHSLSRTTSSCSQ